MCCCITKFSKIEGYEVFNDRGDSVLFKIQDEQRRLTKVPKDGPIPPANWFPFSLTSRESLVRLSTSTTSATCHMMSPLTLAFQLVFPGSAFRQRMHIHLQWNTSPVFVPEAGLPTPKLSSPRLPHPSCTAIHSDRYSYSVQLLGPPQNSPIFEADVYLIPPLVRSSRCPSIHARLPID